MRIYTKNKYRSFLLFLLIIAFFIMQITTSYSNNKKPNFIIYDSIAGSWNEKGLNNTFIFAKYFDLSVDENPLLKDTYLEIGFLDEFSPAYNRAGIYFEYQPIGIFTLNAGLYHNVYYTLFGYGFQRFESVNTNWSSKVRDDYKNETTEHALYIQINPTLILPFDPSMSKTILKNLFIAYSPEYHYWSFFDSKNKDIAEEKLSNDSFYEYRNDIIQNNKNWTFVHSFLLLYKFSEENEPKCFFTVKYDKIIVRDQGKASEKIGPMFIWEFAEKMGFIDRPRIITLIQYYIDDKYKKDEFYYAFVFTMRHNIY